MIVTAKSENISIELDCGCVIEEQKNFDADFQTTCADHGTLENMSLADVMAAAVKPAPKVGAKA